MLFSFIGLCIAWINDKKNRLLPYMNQRVIYPAPPCNSHDLSKKENQKAAFAGYANSAILLFSAVSAKEPRLF